ncbi:GFA family protein [Stappia sp. BW2]|uniref:GFA family protein n=1 Tax=Stappia sp. BW2 TaxID=2592622 RepID=UPI0011DEDE5F|nr:GFA family protein [Stappia sp. BW2]TYC77967.1 GFA family protein [Stappia sp. BW2]
MTSTQGGCLCGELRYEVQKQPARTTMCHCKFCQRATGGAYLVEPVFESADFTVIRGTPKRYTHLSEGSGKKVYIHFCDNCGTKLFLTFERFEGFVGVYGGTLDDPNWLKITPENSKHIFLGVAQRGTVIPPHFDTFDKHATENDGTPIAATVYDEPHIIGKM